MSEKKNPLVFLDVSIDGDPVEKIVIEVTHCSKCYLLYFSAFRWKEIAGFSLLLGCILIICFLFWMISFLLMLFPRLQRILGHSVLVIHFFFFFYNETLYSKC